MKIIIALLVFFLAACGNSPAPITPVTPDAALKHATGLIKDPKSRYGQIYWRPLSLYFAIKNHLAADTYDSRQDGCELPVKNQGGCGSCWEFGSVGTAEINYCKQTGDKSVATSPWATQPGVSCDTDFFGCNGGLFSGTFHQKYGFVKESDWPYTSGGGNTGRCDNQKLTTLTPVVKPKSFVYLGAPSRNPTYDEVTTAIFQYGAVAVSAGAGGDWESYGNDESQILSRCQGTSTNHEISAVAYHKATQDVTIKNSWGREFGANGYMRIKWGCDSLSEDAGFFIFEGTPCQPPKIHLPAEYVVNAGDDVTLAVKAETGVTYTWYQGTTVVGTGAVATVLPTAETTYRLVAKTNCGEAEIQTLVVLKNK